MRKRKPRRRNSRLGMVLGLGLLAAALVTELSKPKAERRGEGRVAGFVPYDFRPPSMARAKARLWNPKDERVFVPTVFGVGWTVNAASIVRPLAAVKTGNGDA